MIMVVMAKNALLKSYFAFLICISFLLIEGMSWIYWSDFLIRGFFLKKLSKLRILILSTLFGAPQVKDMDLEGISFMNCE
jgi:hypothetical protein